MIGVDNSFWLLFLVFKVVSKVQAQWRMRLCLLCTILLSRHSSSLYFKSRHPWLHADTTSGASGTGRTTFINTLIDQPLLEHRVASLRADSSNPHSAIEPRLVHEAATKAHEEVPIRIKPYTVELDEDGTRIALTIVDTPGFGDGIDNEYW